MRILMLGWEFPPYIAGGLGVACEGLTRALDAAGHHVTFVLPQPVHSGETGRVRVVGHDGSGATPAPGTSASTAIHADSGQTHISRTHASVAPVRGFQHATFRTVPASFRSPYPGMHASGSTRVRLAAWSDLTPGVGVSPPEAERVRESPSEQPDPAALTESAGGPHYAGDLIAEAHRYARACVRIARSEEFDVVHAHDWLTFPAGLAIRRATGRPLIVHVHSTEFDRSGTNINQRVFEVERDGMLGADRVIAVSRLTKSICEKRYGCDPDKIDVIYNGVDTTPQHHAFAGGARPESGDRVVLFLGRITMQKGPEYFLAAAQRVLEKMSNVKFVLAGSGDMALRMAEMAAGLGIGDKVFFTGFLRGEDVERVFRMADCYVMPSVSEPFGIAALEALSFGVPVIISKTSGAGEVLEHVLKVDFWDVDAMADRILAVLRHPPLAMTLREHAAKELRRLTWDEAARKCVRVYEASQARSLTGAADA